MRECVHMYVLRAFRHMTGDMPLQAHFSVHAGTYVHTFVVHT